MKKRWCEYLFVMNNVVLCLVDVLIYVLLNKSDAANVVSKPATETVSTNSFNETEEDSEDLFDDE